MLLGAEIHSSPLGGSEKLFLKPALTSGILSENQCSGIIALAHKEDRWRASNFGQRLIYSLPSDLCDMVWELVRPWVPSRIKGRRLKGFFEPTAQLFWYQRGDRFPPHSDRAAEDEDGGISYFTVVIYLNNCKGGGTYFPDLGLLFQPALGSALIFPQDLVHESQVLTSDSKYILRAQVMYI
ncbi:2OG-Fe(II) oxygenase [Pseudobacteriovorax antillogorgiicola]|uniref:2OG-Fe(II) oxygenase superfamily protein n=1 Tax=Pseudobacteriovorax antillogorgiicola TaxID=1513793 RepID=A0A1Y6CEX3_9BACT|nr:2OG-Fe(II) oxygenase [Pseudobacteriovorax antillogorgiicola]TCS47620.1 2-oxoglutarate-Fe(II)-dependent oxygenase superfamily protein [Pseudobacteriovorax antillogorgiicola]SMF60031.1 2OG-Fe(II) oxygenase superfamily protein [Pseudobacteriovorax antillogorgiicola]